MNPADRCEQIVIDGPAASGKSTLAGAIADRLGAAYVNTGDMYRTLTWVVLGKGIDPTRAESLASIVGLLGSVDIRYVRGADGRLSLQLDDEPVPRSEIRSARVAGQVSHVARIPEVRQWMLQRQRAVVDIGLIVMEGRDIGTVVFPEARHKFFVTASPEERARRRLYQGGETVDGATLASVAAEIAARDHMDMTRPVAPLRPADDAVQIDTTGLTEDQVVDAVLAHVQKRWEQER
jgi:cytidylate kinase